MGVSQRSAGSGMSHAKENIEEEMVDLAAGMKGCANSWLMTLKRDNQVLSEISKTQDKNLDAVNAEVLKGKKMMKSGNLSFFCTIVMLVVSIVVFFMMIPFIIIT